MTFSVLPSHFKTCHKQLQPDGQPRTVGRYHADILCNFRFLLNRTSFNTRVNIAPVCGLFYVVYDVRMFFTKI